MARVTTTRYTVAIYSIWQQQVGIAPVYMSSVLNLCNSTRQPLKAYKRNTLYFCSCIVLLVICESLVRARLTGVPVKLNMLGSTPSAIKIAWRCRMRFSCTAIRRRYEGEEEGEEGHKVGHGVGQGLDLTRLCEVSLTSRTHRTTVAGDIGGRTGSVARSSLRPHEAIAKGTASGSCNGNTPAHRYYFNAILFCQPDLSE